MTKLHCIIHTLLGVCLIIVGFDTSGAWLQQVMLIGGGWFSAVTLFAIFEE